MSLVGVPNAKYLYSNFTADAARAAALQLYGGINLLHLCAARVYVRNAKFVIKGHLTGCGADEAFVIDTSKTERYFFTQLGRGNVTYLSPTACWQTQVNYTCYQINCSSSPAPIRWQDACFSATRHCLPSVALYFENMAGRLIRVKFHIVPLIEPVVVIFRDQIRDLEVDIPFYSQ